MFKAGVIGCRGIGVSHAGGIVGSDHARLAAACDLDQEMLDDFRQRWPDEDIAQYKNHRELLENEALDIVTVATSDHRHADLVVDAAKAGVKGIFCEKPLATNLADADRMIAACEQNGTVLSVDHTRRFQPLWRHAKEQIVDQGVIGPVQYVVGNLSGPRAMLFRNGTHTLDAICYYAGAEPQWVTAELEEGYEDYTEYRGDGGHQPATEPGANGYIHFANGVRGFYLGGSKNTPPPKQHIEVVGATGRLGLNGDQGILYRGDEPAAPVEYPEWPVSGIPAGVQELVKILAEGGEPISPGRAGRTVVELIIGFLESQRQGHIPVAIPMPRG
ncbi:MAG: Gfo/Idh/MocA family oxidoreductase [Candidatus Latescibacterota bacterium]|nr:Gfo/Idh/MocA family oxidoreductase [Candidatus Latescibacterota bacterium]